MSCTWTAHSIFKLKTRFFSPSPHAHSSVHSRQPTHWLHDLCLEILTVRQWIVPVWGHGMLLLKLFKVLWRTKQVSTISHALVWHRFQFASFPSIALTLRLGFVGNLHINLMGGELRFCDFCQSTRQNSAPCQGTPMHNWSRAKASPPPFSY